MVGCLVVTEEAGPEGWQPWRRTEKLNREGMMMWFEILKLIGGIASRMYYDVTNKKAHWTEKCACARKNRAAHALGVELREDLKSF